MNNKEFIEKVAKHAQEYSDVFFPSVTIAQAILESNSGKSELAKNANNIFGMKADDKWDGEVYVKDATEEIDGKWVNVGATKWRKYNDIADNFADHDKFLTRTDWHKNYYKDAINATNYVEQANALTGKYATDSAYGSKLIKIIEDNELYKYDEDGEKVTKKEDDKVSQPLKGKKIYIDAGHGGMDSGASANGLVEKHWNLEVSMNVSAMLRELGAEVIETRTTDVYHSLTARTNKAMANKVDVLLSIHFNALAGSSGNGYEDFIHDTLSGAEDVKLQNAVHAEVVKILPKYSMGNRGKKRANFHMLREAKGIPAVLVEAGFCTNWHDSQQLKKPEFKRDFELAMVNGLIAFFGGEVVKQDDVKPSQPVKPTPVPVENADVYTVKSGDTLSGIAQKFGVTVDNLVAWNNIENKNVINVGQVLTVKNGTTVYTVKAGDNLTTIARKFGTTAENLASLNELANPNLINVGQKLRVNGTEVVTVPTTKPLETQVVYTVKAGDTLSEIAQKNGTTADIIARTNGISNPNLIRVGQKLTITKKATAQPDKAQTPAKPNLKVGAKVVLRPQATHYATGQAIPKNLLNKTYTIQEIGNGRVLLKELYSWVVNHDLIATNGASAPAPAPTVKKPNISVGAKVKLRKQATHYATKEAIPRSLVDKVYTIQEVGNGRVLLKELYSWVLNQDLEGI